MTSNALVIGIVDRGSAGDPAAVVVVIVVIAVIVVVVKLLKFQSEVLGVVVGAASVVAVPAYDITGAALRMVLHQHSDSWNSWDNP